MWKISYTEDSEKDFRALDGAQKKIAYAMIEKLKINPLPKNEGGYGSPLGNDDESGNLTGYLKLKSRGSGIRIVYELKKENEMSVIVVIGMREDKEVYKIASKRVKEGAKSLKRN